MDEKQSPSNLNAGRFKACLFDMDGVLTDTASVHAAAWKSTFDQWLEHRAGGGKYEPFSIEVDYHRYVDGKPRSSGVKDFIESRGAELPMGETDDAPGWDTIWSIANKKNEEFWRALDQKGVDVYESSVEFVKAAKAAGMRTGVVSSSANTVAVLTAAGILDLFETRVDGVTILEEGLPGKPAPDTFVEAARRLGATPADAIVFEDAISGVQAGRAGDFGLVVGVDRVGEAQALLDNGADFVVQDLSELISHLNDSTGKIDEP